MQARQLGGLNLNEGDAERETASRIWKTRLDLAGMAYEKGLYTAALRNYHSGLALAQTLGATDQEIAKGLLGMAKCYCELGRFPEAESLYKRVLEIDQRTMSSRQALVLDLNDLASLYLKVGRLSEAEDLLKKSVEILDSSRGPSIELAETRKNLGQLYFQGGKLAEAEHQINQAFTICDTSTGRQTKLFAEILMVLGLVLAHKGSFNEAEEAFERAIERLEMLTGGAHPELADFLDAAASLFQIENLPERVSELTKRAKSIRKHIRETDH